MQRKRYGLMKFLLDVFLLVITGGLWGLYLIFRALNKR
jgi:hypothetical protein